MERQEYFYGKKISTLRQRIQKSIRSNSVFVILEVLLEILIPLIMAKMIDTGIGERDIGSLLSLSTTLIVCVVLGMLFGMLSGSYSAAASAGFARNLRQDMYDRISDYSFANIDKFSTSSIVTRLTTDVTNVQNAYMMIIRVAVRAPLFRPVRHLASSEEPAAGKALSFRLSPASMMRQEAPYPLAA